jgi:hypothetical protein
MNSSIPLQSTKWQRLLEHGWHQGTLFRSEKLALAYNTMGPEGNLDVRARQLKSKEVLVVASQDWRHRG